MREGDSEVEDSEGGSVRGCEGGGGGGDDSGGCE